MLKRIARNFDNDRARLTQFEIKYYAMRKDGEFAGGCLWAENKKEGKSAPFFAVNDGGESRLEACVTLLD